MLMFVIKIMQVIMQQVNWMTCGLHYGHFEDTSNWAEVKSSPISFRKQETTAIDPKLGTGRQITSSDKE